MNILLWILQAALALLFLWFRPQGLVPERRRVHERFGVALEPEVQLLGEVEWPAVWELPG